MSKKGASPEQQTGARPCGVNCCCASFLPSGGCRFFVGLVLAVIAVGLLAYVGYAFVQKQTPDQSVIQEISGSFENKTIYIVSKGRGRTHEFKMEVAKTKEQQALGLMYRDSLQENEGMLFIFFPPREASFWMKNTSIPLDILFVRLDGTISKIHKNATPYDLTPIKSDGPVTAVVEIGGGEADRLGIQVGDYLQ